MQIDKRKKIQDIVIDTCTYHLLLHGKFHWNENKRKEIQNGKCLHLFFIWSTDWDTSNNNFLKLFIIRGTFMSFAM